jgi:urease accessory protein
MSASRSAAASVHFRAGIGGEPVLREMHPSASHTFQPDRWGATVVGSAAHPVAGDQLGLLITIGVGCGADIRSSAPMVARPGAQRPAWAEPAQSTFEVKASVASDGMLTWRPEPSVATDGATHRSTATIEMAGSARLVWRDEFLLDHRGEATPGTWTSRVRVVRDGWPIVCTELGVGPGCAHWESPAVLEGANAVSQTVIVDPGHAAEWKSARATEGAATGVALPLAGPAIHVVAWGDDLSDCRTAVERLLRASGVPGWASGRWRSSPRLGAAG